MNFKKVFEVALGVVTAFAGFLEAGSIATSAQAGAEFGYQLVWPIALGTICVVFLIEMSGRLAAVSHHPLPAAVRERFGINFAVVPWAAEAVVDFLVLATEIAGAALGLQLLTGVSFRVWAAPVAIVLWLLLWNGKFSVVEYGVSFLGLLTLVFMVAAIKAHPDWAATAKGLVPTLPAHDKPTYWFLAVSILGATVSPYLFNFYSSGAVEDEWGEDDLVVNRVTAGLGMGFGGLMSLAVLVAAAAVLAPRGIDVDQYEQLALLVTGPLGRWGYYTLGAALFIACLGAAMELSLDLSYVFAQTLGWNWGENERPRDAARFSMVYTLLIAVAWLPAAIGIDPLKLTMYSMAFTALILPLVVLPLLVLMNDPHYVGEHRNGRAGNIVVFLVIVMTAVVAVVSIPLVIAGGK
jgi:Mn2+/Fe2+ NRAMP family transporter